MHGPVVTPGSRSRRPLLALVALAAGLASAVAPAGAQSTNGTPSPARQALAAEDYAQPEATIRDAVMAPRWENVTPSDFDPTGRRFVHAVSDGPATLASFAKPHLNLGALQIDPAADRHRRLTTRSDAGFHIISAVDGSRTEVEIPAGARVTSPTWSPDGSRLAFLAHFDDETHLYVADADDGDSRRVSRDALLATHVTSPVWTADGRELAVVLPPEDRGPMPRAGQVPQTPMVRHTTDVENRLRTYFDLLENPHEKALVRYFSTGQLAVIDVESRQVTRIGEPAMITDIDPAPDGEYFRVEMLEGELSYIVPTTSSASREELWSRDGTVVTLLEERAAREGADDDDEDDDGPERRGLTWHATEPGLVYLQMEPSEADDADDADAPAADDEEESPRMDRVVHWAPPFDSTSTTVLYATEERMNSVAFDADATTLFVTRGNISWTGEGRQTVHAVRLDAPDEEHLIVRRSGGDITDDPGSLAYTRNERGRAVVRTSSDGGSVYLQGTRYFEDPMEQAPRPFVDRVSIADGETERMYEGSEGMSESVRAVLDDDATAMVVMRESPTMYPQAYHVDRTSGDEVQITDNVDHTPEITSTRREVIMVTRPDGFESKVEITLPVGWSEGDPAPPAFFWFYPREYTEQDQYFDRNIARWNKNDFPSLGMTSKAYLTLTGYALVDPDLPIVGESGQMNDNYIPDLRNTLSAVIDTLAARGWIDRDRLGLGGHSYGAFGTANAMVNTPFFKAGIAGDGNYNRSLTPAGFQTERRMLWESEQTYIEMSPFFVADRLSGALLMYHGMDDHNVGTHPDHSRRLFHALNVLGKEAALYMYPYEDHGPRTRETILDLWARWTAWLDLHVKGEGVSQPITQEDGAAG